MLAYHPITKKEIRILNSDASISKTRKTLIVSKENRLVWDTVHEVKKEDTFFPNYAVCLEQVSVERLKEICENTSLTFVKKEVIADIGVENIRKHTIRNMICLEEMEGLYPQLGPAWNGFVEDAYLLVAGLLQYKVLNASFSNTRSKFIPIEISQEPPMKLWWITQYYVPDKAKRKREIDGCLRNNLQSPLIDKLIVLNEKEESYNWLHKEALSRLEEKVIGHRLTYQDVLKEVLTIPDDVMVAFANADIQIDSKTWRQLWDVDLTDKCLALLRYDVPESNFEEDAKLFGPRADSQDTWVIQAKDMKKRIGQGREPTLGGEEVLKGLDIRFGQMGCDNAFALEMFRKKFLVVNPAYSLKTFHYHNSGIRNYKTDDVVHNPVFMYVHPSGFHDLEPVSHLPVKHTIKPSTIQRTVMGSGSKDWLERMNRSLASGTEPWKLNTSLTPVAEPVLELTNCFQNENGLCYDTNKMYIGKGQHAQQKWSESVLKRLPVTIESQQGLIVPFDKEVMKSRERYVLEYMSRVLRLRAIANQAGEFFCPDQKGILDTLHMFQWESQMPLIKYENDIQIWHHQASIFPVTENKYMLQEDVEALRKACKMWNPVVETFTGRFRLVIVVDGKVITEELLNEYEEVLERAWDVRVVYAEKTSSERLWDVMRGAWGIVIGGGCGLEVSGWNWLLPKEAVVVEVQGNQAPNATAFHMSSIAGLEHRFVNTTDSVKVFDEIWSEYERTKEKETEDTSLPIVYLPRKDMEGYFAHAGDSFREMAYLWAKRGYCRVKEHQTATHCWWGSVGAKGVLLYDRPNHDWRLAAPLPEKEYSLALFGNPKPAEKGKAWFFWPRKPELVEQLVEEKLPNWNERIVGPVFYGKIENRVQEKRRTKLDWSLACEKGEYVMTKGTETKYALTHEEYLRKLSKARFGLCLAGYGNKCHREVECMAMGCVPVVAPEVDMDSYAEPPVEGIHYIRVQTPEEAYQRIQQTGEQEWMTMSNACRTWWKRNCSCEGSFQLTKQLIEV
jgi:hypothetical protein